jgi:hypothetical protein
MGTILYIRRAYMISPAYGLVSNDKVGLYNGSVMMLTVQEYYYAAMRIQRYHDMRLCRYAHMRIKRQRYNVMVGYNGKMI